MMNSYLHDQSRSQFKPTPPSIQRFAKIGTGRMIDASLVYKINYRKMGEVWILEVYTTAQADPETVSHDSEESLMGAVRAITTTGFNLLMFQGQ